MEAAWTSETLVSYHKLSQPTRTRHNSLFHHWQCSSIPGCTGISKSYWKTQ